LHILIHYVQPPRRSTPFPYTTLFRSNRDKLCGSTSAGRGNLLPCVTGTLQVLTLYSKSMPKCHLSRLRAPHSLCADGTFIGRDLCHQAFRPFDAEDLVFSSNPVSISVSRPNFSACPKEAFGG